MRQSIGCFNFTHDTELVIILAGKHLPNYNMRRKLIDLLFL